MNILKEKQWTKSISVMSTVVGVAIWLVFMLPQTLASPSVAPLLGGLWHASLPVSAAVLGWFYGTKAWHCGVWMLGVHLLLMVVISGFGNMFPVVAGYYVVLVAVCALAAFATGYVRTAIQSA